MRSSFNLEVLLPVKFTRVERPCTALAGLSATEYIRTWKLWINSCPREILWGRHIIRKKAEFFGKGREIHEESSVSRTASGSL